MTDAATPASAPRKRSIGKLIAKLALLFAFLVVVGLIVLFLAKDSLVRAGVVRGGKEATEQETSLTQASLALFGGSVSLDDLGIRNLEGYKEKNLLVLKSGSTSLDVGSLFTHTVVIREINLEGLELWLEQNGAKNNFNDLMAVIQKKMPAAGQTQNTSPGKELKIQKLVLKGTKVHIRGLFNKDFDLDTIEMNQPTNPDGRQMKIADLVARILLNVSKQIIEDPRLPGELRDSMKNVSAVVDKMRGTLDKDVKQFSTGLEDLKKDPLKGAQELGKTGKDLGKDLKNLNPFDKPKTQPK